MRAREPMIAVLGGLTLLFGACAGPAAVRAGPAAPIAHRPELVTGVGAEGLAAPLPPRRPERIARTESDLESSPDDEESTSDLSETEIPPPPVAGTYVVPERVEMEEEPVDEAYVPPPPPPPPSTRRRRALQASDMNSPIFSSPSVFAPTGPSSAVPAPPMVQ